jgi:DNA-binding NarL/FixJ family response regulator
MRTPATQHAEALPERLGLIWIDCPYPVASVGLARILEAEARVHVGQEPPKEEGFPSVVIFGVGAEGITEGVKRVRRLGPDALVLVFSLHLDLALARVALRAGARGFVHAGMTPEQIVRAVSKALEGEIVAPRQLLEYLITDESLADLDILSSRQREILELVTDGLSNAQIAKRLYLTESTVKQHLRSAYKILGVRNRTEAAKLVRNGD